MKNIPGKVDVIILSLVKDDETFNKTKGCIDSYINTADDIINNIFVVETNTNFDGDYNQPKVKIIKPDIKFNYNKFFNIALKECKAEFIIGPNNDLQIHDNCIQNLIKQFKINVNIHSISPIDRNWHRHKKMYLPTDDKLYYGYDVSLHMFGCIFCCRRSVIEKIGYLDERFHFFYQDNDYVMSLERCNLLHGIYTGSHVSHVTGATNKHAADDCKYTPTNMNTQGNTLMQKWNSEPFKSGGYKTFKDYTF